PLPVSSSSSAARLHWAWHSAWLMPEFRLLVPALRQLTRLKTAVNSARCWLRLHCRLQNLARHTLMKKPAVLPMRLATRFSCVLLMSGAAVAWKLSTTRPPWSPTSRAQQSLTMHPRPWSTACSLVRLKLTWRPCPTAPMSLGPEDIEKVRYATKALAEGIGVKGLMNVQYGLKDNQLYVIEANPRASRTVPFVSKATGVQLAKAASRIMLGSTIMELKAE